MTEFIDCERVILEGGQNDGLVIPVRRDTNAISFHVKGGGVIRYHRIVPLEFWRGHIVFRLERIT
jgi:hypothetical protein